MLILKIVRGGEGIEGLRLQAQVPSTQARFTIGRDPGCDWCIPDRTLAVSARHCEIARAEGRVMLRDLSTNGTFVNGARERLPADHPLRAGDRIVLGNFLVEVSEAADAAAPPETRPGVARRGGDPAAMIGADWERVAIRPAAQAAAASDVKTGLTRISKPPPRQGGERVPPADTTPVATPQATVPAPAPGDPIGRLAHALGVPAQALGTTGDALQLAERLARLLRAAVIGLHQQMALQARQQRQLGSRAPLGPLEEPAGRLRMAASPEEAVAVLLGAGDAGPALLQRASRDAAEHSFRLMGAFEKAGLKLGEQLAPATLERAAQGGGDAARVWRMYGSLWQAMGLPPDQPWARGFRETLAAYAAAAYDESAPKA